MKNINHCNNFPMSPSTTFPGTTCNSNTGNLHRPHNRNSTYHPYSSLKWKYRPSNKPQWNFTKFSLKILIKTQTSKEKILYPFSTWLMGMTVMLVGYHTESPYWGGFISSKISSYLSTTHNRIHHKNVNVFSFSLRLENLDEMAELIIAVIVWTKVINFTYFE